MSDGLLGPTTAVSTAPGSTREPGLLLKTPRTWAILIGLRRNTTEVSP